MPLEQTGTLVPETSGAANVNPATRWPASPAQRRVLAQLQLMASTAEEITRAYWLEGDVETRDLVRALTEVAGSRDMLRARLLVTEDGQAVQEIRDHCDGVDVVPVDGGRAELEEVIHRSRATPLTDRRVWFQAIVYPCRDGGHGLLLRMHHGLVDGYAVALVERQLWETLGETSAAGSGSRPRYADSPVEDVDAAAIEWWDRRMAGAVPATVAPDRAGEPPLSAGSIPLQLSPDVMSAVRVTARELRTTPLTVLLTAHLITIGVYSGQSDVVAATPYLNRDTPQTRDLVGPLVNLLPIRVRLTSPEMRDMVAVVGAELRSALAHTAVPFDRIVAGTPGVADGGFGVVRTAIVLNPPTVTPPPTARRFTVAPITLPATALRWDLVITLREDGDGLTGALLYRADRYTETTARSVRDHFLAVLGGTTPIGGRPLPARSVPAFMRDALTRLLDLTDFADEDPVVVAAGRATSRAQFDVLATGYAARITNLGPRSCVGLALRDPMHQATALLATWRCGGTALLLDPRHPADRRDTVLCDAEPAIVFTEPIESVDEEAPPRTSWRREDIAYLVYTSGTDGQPKGVAATYANLEHLLATLAAVRAPLPGQNPLGPGFDGWLWATLLPWLSGHPAVFPERGVADVVARIDGQDSSITLTPTMLAELESSTAPQTIVAAGEPLPAGLAERWSSGHRLLNAYGPTELTVCASWADTAEGENPASIGRPVPGTEAYLLDRWLRPVPQGAVGELFVAGPGVTRGYHRKPGQTARGYMANPFADDGSRMYRTGDLARLGADGLLYYMGRLDTQAKISGVRIELGEIVTVVTACAGVHEAGVALHVDENGVVEIWVGVVPDGPAIEGPLPPELNAEIERVCAARLLPEMRPARVAAVRELPKTSNGKLDRPALARKLASTAPLPAAVPTPGNARALLAAVWSAVLGVEIDDYDRTFFSYGGHSLSAAHTVARLRGEFGGHIPITAFFDHPTVNEFSEWLESRA